MDLKQALEYIAILEKNIEFYESGDHAEYVKSSTISMKKLKKSLLASEKILTRENLVEIIILKSERVRRLELEIERLKHGSK